MIEELTAAQIAARVGMSERTIQRYISKGKLQARPLARNRFAIDSDDIDALILPEHAIETTQATATTTAELEARIQALETRLDALEVQRRVNVPMERKERATRATSAQDGNEEDLPEGYIEYRSFWQLHGIPESTAGRFNLIERGNWKRATDGHKIEKAIDAAGRRAFWEKFHTHKDFKPCDACPHEVMS